SAPTTFPTRSEASDWLATVEASIIERRWIDPSAGDTPFTQWADEWIAGAHDLKRRTAAGYRSLVHHHLAPAFGRLTLAPVVPLPVRRRVTGLAGEGASPKTVANVARCLGACMNAAVSSGRLHRYDVRLGKHGNVRMPRDTSPAPEMVTTD